MSLFNWWNRHRSVPEDVTEQHFRMLAEMKYVPYKFGMPGGVDFIYERHLRAMLPTLEDVDAEMADDEAKKLITDRAAELKHRHILRPEEAYKQAYQEVLSKYLTTFTHDFYKWLSGRPTSKNDDDMARTPWQAGALLEVSGVRRFVNEPLDRHNMACIKLIQLIMQTPQNLHECWLYWKYIIRGKENLRTAGAWNLLFTDMFGEPGQRYAELAYFYGSRVTREAQERYDRDERDRHRDEATHALPAAFGLQRRDTAEQESDEVRHSTQQHGTDDDAGEDEDGDAGAGAAAVTTATLSETVKEEAEEIRLQEKRKKKIKKEKPIATPSEETEELYTAAIIEPKVEEPKTEETAETEELETEEMAEAEETAEIEELIAESRIAEQTIESKQITAETTPTKTTKETPSVETTTATEQKEILLQKETKNINAMQKTQTDLIKTLTDEVKKNMKIHSDEETESKASLIALKKLQIREGEDIPARIQNTSESLYTHRLQVNLLTSKHDMLKKLKAAETSARRRDILNQYYGLIDVKINAAKTELVNITEYLKETEDKITQEQDVMSNKRIKAELVGEIIAYKFHINALEKESEDAEILTNKFDNFITDEIAALKIKIILLDDLLKAEEQKHPTDHSKVQQLSYDLTKSKGLLKQLLEDIK